MKHSIISWRKNILEKGNIIVVRGQIKQLQLIIKITYSIRLTMNINKKYSKNQHEFIDWKVYKQMV